MKKVGIIAIIAIVFGGFFFLSAGEEMSPEQKQQMDQIDSMVKEKVDGFKMDKDAECKARALEAAKVKADSMMAATAAMKAKSGMSKKPVVKKPVVKKPATVGNGKPKLGDKSSTTVGNGKPKLGDDPAKKGDDKSSTTVGKGKPKLGGGGI